MFIRHPRLVSFAIFAAVISGAWTHGTPSGAPGLPPASYLGNPNRTVQSFNNTGAADITITSAGSGTNAGNTFNAPTGVDTSACSTGAGSGNWVTLNEGSTNLVSGDYVLLTAPSGGTLPSPLVVGANYNVRILTSPLRVQFYNANNSEHAQYADCNHLTTLTAAGSGSNFTIAKATPTKWRGVSPVITGTCTGLVGDAIVYLGALTDFIITTPGTNCATTDTWTLTIAGVNGVTGAAGKISQVGIALSSWNLTNNRSEGNIPAFVHASAIGVVGQTTTTRTALSWLTWSDAMWRWNFGDTCNGGAGEQINNPATGTTVNLNTDQTGPEAFYVYRCAGTFTITLTPWGWNGTTVFSGTPITRTFVSSAITPAAGGEMWLNPGCVPGSSPGPFCGTSACGGSFDGTSAACPLLSSDPTAALVAFTDVAKNGIGVHFAWGSTASTVTGRYFENYSGATSGYRFDSAMSLSNPAPYNPNAVAITPANRPNLIQTGNGADLVNIGEVGGTLQTDYVISNIKFTSTYTSARTRMIYFSGLSKMYFDNVLVDNSLNSDTTETVSHSVVNGEAGIFNSSILNKLGMPGVSVIQNYAGPTPKWAAIVGGQYATGGNTAGAGHNFYLRGQASAVSHPLQHWALRYVEQLNSGPYSATGVADLFKVRLSNTGGYYLHATNNYHNGGSAYGIQFHIEPNEVIFAGQSGQVLVENIACSYLAGECVTGIFPGADRFTYRNSREFGTGSGTFAAKGITGDDTSPAGGNTNYSIYKNKWDGQYSQQYFLNFSTDPGSLATRPRQGFTAPNEITDNQIRNSVVGGFPFFGIVDCNAPQAPIWSANGSTLARNEYYVPDNTFGSANAAFRSYYSGSNYTFAQWGSICNAGIQDTAAQGSSITVGAANPTGWNIAPGGTSQHVAIPSDMGTWY